MPRRTPTAACACPTRHGRLLSASRSLTKFARDTHPRIKSTPRPDPAPIVLNFPLPCTCLTAFPTPSASNS